MFLGVTFARMFVRGTSALRFLPSRSFSQEYCRPPKRPQREIHRRPKSRFFSLELSGSWRLAMRNFDNSSKEAQ